jgi:ferrous-iron efflux pump FieF
MKKNGKILIKTSLFAIFITITLIFIKSIAWLFSGSLAVLSSLTDSVLDLITSSINFFAIKYSLKPKDGDFKFGYGAVEDIACLLQSSFISGSAIFILFQSVRNLILKQKLTFDFISIKIMIISLILKILLIFVQKYTIKRTNSSIIKAESLNYTADVGMELSVIISLIIINYTQYYFVDSCIAILIAIYILSSAIKIGQRAFYNIMCKEIPIENRSKIIDILRGDKNIEGYHDLKTRMSGNKCFIQIHLEVDKKLKLEDSHKISKNIDKKISKLFDDCEIIIHQDPI